MNALEKNKIKVWLIAEGEPLPIDDNQRLMRVGMLADYLSKQNMEVVWWSSTFIHGKKSYYCEETNIKQLNDNYTLYLLHSKVSYKKNVSLRRILYHILLAKEFHKESQGIAKPDIIICSYPTVQFAKEAIRYGKKESVPVVLDVRDLWPDIFVRAFPNIMQPIAKIGVGMLQQQTKAVFKKADYVCGIVPYCVEWGLKKANRHANVLDQVIYIGYDESKDIIDKEDYDKWVELGVSQETWNICFVSTLSSKGLDLSTCIEAVKKVSKKNPKLKLVICGDGDGLKTYKDIAEGDSSIVFAGWCNNKQIKSLLNISNIGLYCLRNWEDFRDTISNKMIAYMAAKLPILSSLEGYSYQYITKYKMGVKYQEGVIDDCISKIEFLIAHPELVLEYGSNSRARYEEDFSSAKVAEKFKVMIQKICDRKEDGKNEK